jgi:hypothetical protein
MKPQMLVAVFIGFMTTVIVFGIGAFIMMSIPQLAENAKFLLPAMIGSGLLLAPFVAWRITPLVRLRP